MMKVEGQISFTCEFDTKETFDRVITSISSWHGEGTGVATSALSSSPTPTSTPTVTPTKAAGS